MILTVAIGLCVLYVFYSWLTMKPKNFPPGPPCLPFIGSVLSVPVQYAHLHMMEWRKKYGPLVGFMFGSSSFIAVCEPSTAIEVLKREEFQFRPDTFIFRTRSFNKRLGIFFSDGGFWVEQRRFALRHLRNFGFGKTSTEDIMQDEVSHVIKKLQSSSVVPISGLFNLSFVNVLWVAMAGTRISRDDDKFHQFINESFDVFREGSPAGGIINVLPALRFIFPNLGGIKTMKNATTRMQEYLKEIILEHERTLVPESPRDFIDVYILQKQLQQAKEDSTFTDEALIMTCMDLFAAGVESTSNTLSFAVMYMVLHPEVQKKVHEELDRVVGRDRVPSMADRQSLPYVEAVLAETMRSNTIAPISPPHRANCDTHLNGYFIPKDSLLLISLWSLMQDEHHWGDPENFRPERFIDSTGKFVKDDWMINFGTGKRVCVGESLARNSLFIFFTSLMQKFSFSLPPGELKPSTTALPGITTAPQPFNFKIDLRA